MSRRNVENDLALLGCFGLLVSVPLLTVYLAILNAFVLQTLWGWFVVPFFELPPLSIPFAIGFGMIVSFLTFQFSEADQKVIDEELKDRHIAYTLLVAVTRPTFRAALTLAIGYIVTLFI